MTSRVIPGVLAMAAIVAAVAIACIYIFNAA